MKTNYLIDFDSTFTQVEALDELATIVLKNVPRRDTIIAEINNITHLAMLGELTFDKALSMRLDLLSITQKDIQELVDILHTKVSHSFIKNVNWLQIHAKDIYIISGGFKEFIIPVVSKFGLHENQVYANDFVLNDTGNVIGFNTDNLLSQAQGKVKLVKQLQLEGRVIIIGDGYTDYEIKLAGLAEIFYLYTENICRDKLIDKADGVVNSLDEIINNE